MTDTVKHHLWWEAAQEVAPCVLRVLVVQAFSARTGAGESSEDRQHAAYLEVREEGKVWGQDWIGNLHLEDGRGSANS